MFFLREECEASGAMSRRERPGESVEFLTRRRYKVVSHPESRGRSVLHKGVEQEEDRLPYRRIALQLERPSIYVPLQ